MRIVACPDAFALEAAFRERLAALAAARPTPFAPLTVVAPTARLLRRLQAAAAETLGAAAAIRFDVHRALARRVLGLARSAAGTRPLASGVALEVLAEEAAASAGARLAEPLARFDDAGATLAATLRDLRDAGLRSRDVPRGSAGLSARTTALLEALAALEIRLDGACLDDAALFREASSGADAARAGLGPVLHVGPLDLTGAVRGFLERVDAAGEIECLALGLAAGPAFEWGWRGVERIDEERADPSGAVPWSAESLLGARCESLFDDAATIPGALEAGAVEWIAAPSAREELAAAARTALRWHGEGVALREIALLARSLADYAPILEPVLAAHGLPFGSSATLPALRDPGPRAALDLLDLLADDFRREPLLRLLRARRLQCVPEAEGRAVPVDRLERCVRRAGRDGSALWREELPASLATLRDGASDAAIRDALADELVAARALAGWVAEIEARATEWRGADPWGPQSIAVERLAAGVLLAGDPQETEALAGALRETASLDGLVAPPGSRAVFVRRLASSLERSRRAVRRGDAGGIAVLDLQQARGLSFRRAVILGCQEGALPRAASEDPWLRDEQRDRLERAARARGSRASIPRKGSPLAEERHLFALALASVRERLVLSWQRLDEGGRPRGPSTFLRDVARVVRGPEAARDPAVASPGHGAASIPVHPGWAAARQIEREGMADAETALVAAALGASEPAAAVRDVARSLGRLDPALEDALAHVETTDRFAAASDADLRFDGRVGPCALERLSVSALDRLGKCPMRFFLQDRLRLERWIRPEDEDLVEPREIGSFLHATLHRLYDELPWDRADSNPSEIAEAGRARLGAALDAEFAAVERGRLRAHPAVARALRSLWGGVVEDFVREDLAELAAGGARLVSAESRFETDVSFGAEGVVLRGTLDRVTVSPEGEEVADYKTGASGGDAANLRAMERGASLQLALYALARESETGALPTVVAAVLRPDRTGGIAQPAKGKRVVMASKLLEKREAIRRRIAELLRLARAGIHPITLERSRCERCDVRVACRRTHVPTRRRVETAAIHAAYHGLEAERGGAAEEDAE